MEYKDIEKAIITGHNVDFEYDDKNYSITKTPKMFEFAEVDTDNKVEYTNALQLLIKSKIDGKSLDKLSEEMTNIKIY